MSDMIWICSTCKDISILPVPPGTACEECGVGKATYVPHVPLAELEEQEAENAELRALLVRALPAVDKLASAEVRSNEANTHSAEITHWQDVWAATQAALAKCRAILKRAEGKEG